MYTVTQQTLTRKTALRAVTNLSNMKFLPPCST